MTSDASTPQTVPGRRFWLATALLCAGVTLAGYYPVLGYGLTDIDTFLNIREARVDGVADLTDQVAKPLTGGRAGLRANFYRPATMLVYAGLRAAFGWRPAGYHVFDLLLHAANGLLLALLAVRCARRVGYRHPRAFAISSALFLLLHPVAAHNVPAIARMSDLLVTTFSLGTLIALEAALPRAQGALARGPLALALASFALTITTKEPGLVLLPGVALFVLWLSDDSRLGDRVKRALVVSAPCAGIAAAFMAVRARVLEDAVGGYASGATLSLQRAISSALMYPELLVVDLWIPGYAARARNWIHDYVDFSLLDYTWVALLIGAAVLLVVAVRRSGSLGDALIDETRRAREFAAGPTGRLLGFSASYTAAFLALFVATGSYSARILYPTVAAASFAPGLAVVWLGATIGRGAAAGASRLAAAAAAAVAVAVFLSQTPVFHRYDDWRNSGEMSHLVTEGMRDQWSALPAGARIYLLNFGGRFTVDEMLRRPFMDVSTVYGPSYYSVVAWLEEHFPEKRFALIQLGAPKWEEPLQGFRHDARIEGGWLVYDVPRATRLPFDLRPVARTVEPQRIAPSGWNGDEAAFRAVELGPQRLALMYDGDPPPDSFVVVFDGRKPFVAPLSALTGEQPRPGVRAAVRDPE